MSLLPWFLKIPGHDQNVRMPSAPFRIAARQDTAATDEPPMIFTWGSTPGSEWNFDMSFQVKQGIPADLTWESYSKQPSKEHQAAFEWREMLKWWSKNPPPTSRSPEEALYDSELRWQQQQEQEYQKHRIGRWTDETIPQIVKWI